MRTRTAAHSVPGSRVVPRVRGVATMLGAPVLLVIGLGLTACSGDPENGASAPVETREPVEPATEVIELAPFAENGDLAEGWGLDDSALSGGGAVSAEYCGSSEHGAGENTVSCGSSADATSACWLTEQSTRIACLDEASPRAKSVRLVALDGAAPAATAATDDPVPLWLELEDGSVFRAVNGGAFTPPEGYFVAYTRVNVDGDGEGADDGEGLEEIVVPDDDSAPIIDTSEGLWSVTVGTDGEQGVETRRVERAWLLAGRTLPESADAPGSAATGVDAVNGRWCDAPQSQNGYGCVTIALPDFTIEDTGETWPFVHVEESNGTVLLDVEGAPFGTYYPAGVAIPAEMLMGTADLPEQDRIWSGQSGMMLIRG